MPPARVVAPRRVVSHAGRALPLGAPSYEPVPIVARQDMQWDHVTNEFELMWTRRPGPSVPAALEAALLYLTLALTATSSAPENLAHLAHVWRSASSRPRLVARTRTSWLDADRFAALAGIEGLAEEGATLRAVTHVGDLANTSLLALLAELARARHRQPDDHGPGGAAHLAPHHPARGGRSPAWTRSTRATSCRSCWRRGACWTRRSSARCSAMRS
ncbi:MAG: hypothetical protein IPI43_30005 [Sandaracinaceae bacterium]|nr:hypothetical protein [Sandaracinaceae bacterium]